MAHPTYSSTLIPCPFCYNPNSIALVSPKRYEKRYEEKFLENKGRTSYPQGHSGPGDVEARDTSQLTSFSIGGEYNSNPF